MVALAPSQRVWMGLVVLVLVVEMEIPEAQQRCVFDEVQAQTRVVRAAPGHTTNRQRGGRRSQREIAPPTPASPQPIRIRSWIPREGMGQSEAEKERLEVAVGEAVGTVSSLLSVNRVSGPLLLRRDVDKYCKFLWRNASTANYNRCGRANLYYRSETCLDVTIPDDHLAGCDIYPEADSPRRLELRPDGAGLPDTDFLLYLQVQATDRCRAENNVSAYTVHCQTDANGRPVAGVVVVCRDTLQGDAYSHRATVQTLIHELFHALGFSKDLFHTWRDCSSSSQVGACSPRGKVAHPDGSGQMRIYTPSVISALQKHLVTPDPELGGPLENLDAPRARASSHWESRVLQGSIMAPVLGDPATVRIDQVTLAALQDTGWYAVNLSRAQSLVWGDGEGNMFGSLSTCQNESSAFFCTGSGLGCHHLHLHKGACQTDGYLEGCRVYKPLENGSECWKEENSRRSGEEERSGEMFGLDSRCFFSNLTIQSEVILSSGSTEGRCYRHRCTGPNRYQIQVSGSGLVECPAGGAIQIKGYQGWVSCPDRRLCLFPDLTPPPDLSVSSFPASTTSDPPETLTPDGSQTWSPLSPPAGLTALCIASCVGVVATVTVLFRRCCPCRVWIQTAPEGPGDPSSILTLQAANLRWPGCV